MIDHMLDVVDDLGGIGACLSTILCINIQIGKFLDTLFIRIYPKSDLN
jgi:hypothetical protein